jgi:hypothetical protein
VRKRSKISICRRERSHSEERHADHQNRLAAELVCQGSEQECAGHQARQPGTEDRRQMRGVQSPFGADRRSDEADRRGIETVDCHDEEAQQQRDDLRRRQLVRVDEVLDIDGPGR